MSPSKRRTAAALKLTGGHVVTPRKGGGFEHHASCPCGAGPRDITSRRQFRRLPGRPREQG